jgi:hypothetical protein
LVLLQAAPKFYSSMLANKKGLSLIKMKNPFVCDPEGISRLSAE